MGRFSFLPYQDGGHESVLSRGGGGSDVHLGREALSPWRMVWAGTGVHEERSLRRSQARGKVVAAWPRVVAVGTEVDQLYASEVQSTRLMRYEWGAGEVVSKWHWPRAAGG